jgi:hypothetical protein
MAGNKRRDRIYCQLLVDQTTTSKIGQQTGKQTEIKKDKKTHNET